ncbi:centrosomal protein of 89 kDa isoform X3 [Electrophorus electricus]|uniref:centrosomal protein of 89 kDa isoform X3 n=1 Tax=Electrophorus electricus TaxID=8005 RepID=UPI0015D0C060|nr:centrosomal protein of 89 kDa isoform X3 [Electrophorus electricus]
MSKFNFSFRRSERRTFKNIAHGLIPAATIAPRPAVPRTPPPRSPNPSPERPRSALAAAILSSSLTGRTVAIPPPRHRSYSESDCSRDDGQDGFEPYASTALYTRDQWADALVGRPRLPSPRPDYDDDDDDEEEDIEEDMERDENHVYQSLERHSRVPEFQDEYAAPLKKCSTPLKVDDDTDNSALETVSPLNTEEETDVEEGVATKQPPSPLQQRSPSHRSVASSDLKQDRNLQSPKSPTTSTLKWKTSVMMKNSPTWHKERDRSGEGSELQSLRQQAQELVDENDGLKMTVHRLSVELSRYQAHFRPLTKEEYARSSGLPSKGPAPPWLLDMKYLSPLLLAYEDQLTRKDNLLKSCEEDVKRLRARSEEVIQENENLHAELATRSSISNKEWMQLQDQAQLVLEENQVLIEQLELQHTKAKETHTKHIQEVCKISKQVMMLEAEKQDLEAELQTVCKQLHAQKVDFQKAHTALENSVSRVEHTSVTDKLKRQLEEEGKTKTGEVEELQACVGALQSEKRILLLEKTNLSTDVKHLESELQLARQANRKSQRRIDILKHQIEDSLEKELIAHQYLASVVTLAERTAHERDQLVHMATYLEKDKQGVLTRIIESTLHLGKLQEKVKVFKQQATARVCALGRRLREQEDDFTGRAATFQQEIQHLQVQLRDRQEQLYGALQQKREVENELEVMWEATTRESRHLQSMVTGSRRVGRSLSRDAVTPALAPGSSLSPAWKLCVQDSLHQVGQPASTAPPAFCSKQNSFPLPLQRSPMFESDSDQHQNPSSDESEKNGLDFYS